jgi:hypothetical protein
MMGAGKKTMMDAANFWLPIIGGILLGSIALAAWFADNKVAAWGFGIPGAICFLILGVLQFGQAFHAAETPQPNSSAVAIRQARAYVHVLRIEITPVLNQNHDLIAWAFGVTFGNTGNTPANQFRNWKHFDFFPKEKTPAKAEWSVSDDGPSITIPPHSAITTDSVEFPVERFTAVRKGHVNIPGDGARQIFRCL